MKDLLRIDPAVRRVKEGTSSVLVQSGLQESLWTEAMECKSVIFEMGRTYQHMATRLCERQFSSPFEGSVIPFEAEVSFHQISSKDQGHVHLFGT